MAQAGYSDAAVIPIPSSDHTNPRADFTGARLAQAIQGVNPKFVAKPCLYFAKAIPKSSEGGGRNARLIENSLRATSDLDEIGRAVLLDDVFTTGAHVKGAFRFLSNKDVEVEDAFVVGRTAWDRPASMFKCDTEQVHCDGGNLSWFEL
jgi:predicted amidophosphoribosyltransferase